MSLKFVSGILMLLAIPIFMQAQTVQVTVLNGAEVRCVADSVVKIQITPNPSLDLRSVSLNWGDGTPAVTIAKGDSLILQHKYNTSQYLDECAYACPLGDVGGFCVQITVFATYNNSVPENVSKFLTYQMPPVPRILINSNNVVCTGNEVQFNNQTCPNNDPAMQFTWNFGDGTTSTEKNPKHTYQDLGNRSVTLTAKNACGTEIITQPIRVLGEPKAVAEADSNVIEIDADRYVLCMAQGSIVRLNATGTQNASLYNWSISGGGRTRWVNNNNRSEVVRLDIIDPGTYTITFTANNACDRPSRKVLTIEAKAAEALLPLRKQEDGCISLNYRPEPFNANATYKINGLDVPAANFPVTLSATTAPFIVQVRLNNECGDQMRSDTFFVLQPENVSISLPSKDTTVCERTSAIPLRAGPIGGRWVGSNISRQNGQDQFNPTQHGDFPLIYVRGNGTCERRDTIRVIVEENVRLSIRPQTDECLDFDYTTIPQLPRAQYTLNGNPVSSFPVPISVSTNRDVYTVVATFENTCGRQESRDTFIVTGALPVGITQPLLPVNEVCQGDTARSLAALPAGGEFRGDQVIQVGSGFAFNPVNPGTFPVYYVRGDGSCERRDTTTFEVKAKVVLRIAHQQDECNQISYTPSPIIPNAEYSINGVRATTFPIDLGSTSIPYVVEAKLTDVCGTQVVSDTFFVRTPDPLRITSPARDTSVCENSGAFNLEVSAPGGSWQDTRFISNNAGQFSFTAREAGSFKIIYNNGTGSCAQQDSVIIDVQRVSLEAQRAEACFNAATPLQGLPLGGNWSSTACAGCIVGENFDARQLATPADSVEVIYTVVNAIGCTNSDSTFVRITRPQAGFQPQGLLCSNQQIQIDVSATKAERSRWMLGNLPLDPPPFQFIPAGEQAITQIALIGACADTLTQTFTITAPPPSAAFTPSANEGCSPFPVSFRPNEPQGDGLSYTWNFGRTTADSLRTYLPDSNYTYQNDSSRILSYTVSLQIVNQCGSSKEEQLISVLPLPKALIGLDSLSNQCSPVTATITNRSTGAPSACYWDFGNGTRDSTCRNVYTQRYVADTTTRQYLIKLEASNLCGVSMDTFQLTVTSPGVQAFFSLDDYNICPNKTIQFRDASTPLPSRVFWKFGDGGVSQESNPTYIYRDADTTLTVTLIARTGCGYDSLSRKVNIYSLPEVNFATERYACQGQPTQFTNRSNERAAFRWDFGDGQIDSLSYSPQHIYRSGGNMATVSLTIKDFPNGCENTITKPILVRTKPTAEFAVNGDTTGCAPFTVILQNLSRNANRWDWDLGNGERSELENPGTVFSAGTYDITLIASYENICRDTFRLDDAINADECGVFIPNVFSPNGDGKNDYFTLYGGPFSATKIRMMRIYTRWGEVIFERENFDMDNISGWDGKIKGEQPIPGVYVYWIEIEQLGGQTKTYKGDVTLMR